jgi:hypothetical protein
MNSEGTQRMRQKLLKSSSLVSKLRDVAVSRKLSYAIENFLNASAVCCRSLMLDHFSVCVCLLKSDIDSIRGIKMGFKLNDGPSISRCFLKGNKSDQSAVSKRIWILRLVKLILEERIRSKRGKLENIYHTWNTSSFADDVFLYKILINELYPMQNETQRGKITAAARH